MAIGISPSPTQPRERPIPAVPGHRRLRGGALVEFVIIFPLLMMLVFGVWEFGRIFDAWLVSTNAAREGARYAVEWLPTDGDFQTYVRGRVMDYVNSGYGARLNLGDVHISSGDIQVQQDAATGEVTVTVPASIDIWAPAVAPLMGSSSFTVTAWCTMRQ